MSSFLTSCTIPIACHSQELCLWREGEKRNLVTHEGPVALTRSDKMNPAWLLHGLGNRSDQVLIKVHAR
jgi:hypothetical protein